MRGLYNCVICAIYLYLEQTTMNQHGKTTTMWSTMIGNKPKQQKRVIGLKKEDKQTFSNRIENLTIGIRSFNIRTKKFSIFQ